MEMAENNCVVCFKNFRIFSVGECDHPVCFECSTRMRVLCCQNECPMCRHTMEMVVFTERVRPFRRLKRTYALYDTKYHIAFENDYIKDFFESLLDYVCQKCHRLRVFENLENLNEHMKRVHDLYCCELCADNLKIFPREMRYYTKQELNRHKKTGDIDNRSHRGHPLCEFCQVRYLDRDELYRHLRKEHFFCHICDGEGIQQFYGTYSTLRDHYRDHHYLCEEGDCIQESMTSVFPTEIDLKAHKALVHYKNLRNKQAVRQARTLDLEFSLQPRNNDRRVRYGQEAYVEDSSSSQTQANQNSGVNIMASLEQDFPTLGNSSSYHAPRPKFTRDSNNRPLFNDQNFPALGSEASINLNITNSVDVHPSTSGSVTSTNISVQVNHKKMKEKKKQTQPCNCAPSASTLSLTWVEKAKEKKQPSTKVRALSSTLPESTVNPPTMNRKNFPNLQKNAITHESTCPSSSNNKTTKKGKKLQLAPFKIDEGDFSNPKVNYSEATVKNANVTAETKKNKNDTTASSSKAKEERPINLNKDNKTHSFLLNANRKKVKMKPEVLIPLNDPDKSKALLLEHTRVDTAASSSKETNSSKVKDHKVNTVKYKEANCDKKVKDAIDDVKNSEKKTKEKRDHQPSESNKGNKPDQLPKGVEPASSLSKDASSKKNTNVEAKEKNKNQRTKKNSQPEEQSATTKKPPPGFEMSIVPAPPPGFYAVSNCGSAQQTSVQNDTLAGDALFVYQQPDEFVSRNSQLIDKIGESLVKQNEDALNEFKNMSLLFREGYIKASDYYFYCVGSIKKDKFEDVFIDLVALLPNIFKQRELWAVHQSTSTSNIESLPSLVDYCTICLQILKLDDAIFHYSKHGITRDMLLQYSSLEEY